jgi:hypothetical protein
LLLATSLRTFFIVGGRVLDQQRLRSAHVRGTQEVDQPSVVRRTCNELGLTVGFTNALLAGGVDEPKRRAGSRVQHLRREQVLLHDLCRRRVRQRLPGHGHASEECQHYAFDKSGFHERPRVFPLKMNFGLSVKMSEANTVRVAKALTTIASAMSRPIQTWRLNPHDVTSKPKPPATAVLTKTPT